MTRHNPRTTPRAAWRTSSFCTGGGCVEIRTDTDGVAIRATGRPDTVVHVDRAEWQAFLAGVKAGDFDT